MPTSDLEIVLSVATDRLNSGLNDASNKVSSFASNTTKNVGGLGALFEDVGNKSFAMNRGLSAMGATGEAAFARIASGANALGQALLAGAGPVGAILAIGAALTGTALFLKSAIEQATEFEQSTARLGGVLRGVGESDVPAATNAVLAFTAAQEKVTVNSQPALIDAFNRLRPLVDTTAEGFTLLTIAQNLSGKTGRDLNDVVSAMISAHNGLGRSLALLGVHTKDANDKTLGFREEMENAAKFAAGGAADAMDTLAGKEANLNNQIDAVKRALGADLLPALKNFVDFLRDHVNDLEIFITRVTDLAEVIYRLGQIMADVGAIQEHFIRAGLKYEGLKPLAAIEQLKAARDQAEKLFMDLSKPLKLSTQLQLFGKPLTGKDVPAAADVSTIPEGPTKPGASTLPKDTKSIIDQLEHERALGQITVDQEIGKLMQFEDTHKNLAEAQKAELDKKILALEQLTTGGKQFGAQALPPLPYDLPTKADQIKKAPYDPISEARAPFEDAIQAITDKMETEAAARTLTTAAEDAYKVQIDQLTVGMTKLVAQIAPTVANIIALQRATIGLDQADARKSADDLEQSRKLITGLEDLLAKAVPGLQPNPTQGQGAMMFNWVAFLLQAVQNTKAYADIQLNITQIMRVFGEILDSMRPVIDLVLRGLVFLVNAIIDAYNMIARLVNLLGLHVQLLDQINMLYADITTPLIQIVHDIPTLNELATGKIAPLHPSSYYQGGTDPTQSGNVANTFLSKIEGTLTLILAADLLTHSELIPKIESWFSGLSSKLAQLFGTSDQEMRGLLSGAGAIAMGVGLLSMKTTGVMGWLEKIFGVIQIVQGILTIIQTLTAVKTLMGPFPCPEVDQLMETRDRGRVRAGDLKVGDFLRDPEDGWNEIWGIQVKPTTVYRFTVSAPDEEDETIGVNENHRVWSEHRAWVNVRDLKPGDKLDRWPNGVLTVKSLERVGPGEYAALRCRRQRYVLGRSIGHNDSADIGEYILHTVNAAVAGAGGFSTFNSMGKSMLGGFALVGGVSGVGGSSSSRVSNTGGDTFVINVSTTGIDTANAHKLAQFIANETVRSKRNRPYMSSRNPVG